MDFANCPRCGEVFIKGRRNLCQACVEAEQQDFVKVRDYLRENKRATMVDTVEATGVTAEFIIQLIDEKRLVLRDLPNFKLECEGCGAPTQEGRFCRSCQDELIMSLANATEAVRQVRKHTENVATGRYYSRTSGE